MTAGHPTDQIVQVKPSTRDTAFPADLRGKKLICLRGFETLNPQFSKAKTIDREMFVSGLSDPRRGCERGFRVHEHCGSVDQTATDG